MDLVQIRYFLTLARTLSFTQATERCNVTQPALPRSIQRLDEELGGPPTARWTPSSSSPAREIGQRRAEPDDILAAR